MSEDTIWITLMIGPVIISALFALLFKDGNPFTSVGRAERRQNRALRARVAELIERGYSVGIAEIIARDEANIEADKVTRVLRSAGVEP